ncbi:MAG: hypothetical protein BJ554DRAFT_4012 [Olpidium bornovanus]|uniref:Uncharacterized protein n=1 Tax=Olpidium bornovanus TaxID=278681 RepID=A0A8H7ZNC2_9FUNG|nr:MAG: hypothetical protein BJ554DRAFT_4012 [Olpidium bornovanus]
MRSGLPAAAWRHAVLHAAALISLRPSSLKTSSPQELLSGSKPVIKHLRVFGCRVWASILAPSCPKLGAQCLEGIYVGFDSPSIIRYLDPTTGAVLILAPSRPNLGAQCLEGIYVGFDFPSIIRYLDPTTGAVLRARLDNCVFEESQS